MFTVEFALLLAVSGLIAFGSLIGSVRAALPRVSAIRQALDSAPQTRELRYTIREVIVIRNSNVIALPIRPARIPAPLRAAA
ncbi:MAG: hypothetical protein ABL914_04270 [Novosphingobium sp.]|uniref:hypothetical protein n=1 Tax=Novosphingobium sp. TaxID=1874826 RepID=UPI0032BC763E